MNGLSGKRFDSERIKAQLFFVEVRSVVMIHFYLKQNTPTEYPRYQISAIRRVLKKASWIFPNFRLPSLTIILHLCWFLDYGNGKVIQTKSPWYVFLPDESSLLVMLLNWQ